MLTKTYVTKYIYEFFQLLFFKTNFCLLLLTYFFTYHDGLFSITLFVINLTSTY